MTHPLLRRLLPLAFVAMLLGFWQWASAAFAIPPWLLPSPAAIGNALLTQKASLWDALWGTLQTALYAFGAALLSGLLFAVLFTRLRLIETIFYPWLVVLQVTPVVAIAPLIVIWVGIDEAQRALVIVAWIIAFFPIVASAIGGLRSAPADLQDLFRLYRARWWQVLWKLEWPMAIPHILSGAKIAGGLALIGAVTAEFVAGSGTSQGLGWRIIEAGNRLHTDTLFAALFLLAALGVCLFYTLSLVEWLLLRRWHIKYRRH